MKSSSLFSTSSLLLLATTACSQTTAPPSGTCPAGAVQVDGACPVLCSSNADCAGGELCRADGLCVQDSGTAPILEAIDGSGSADATSGHAAHHLIDRLLVTGRHLGAAAFSLASSATAGTAAALDVVTLTDTSAELRLPAQAGAGDYLLSATNASGSDQVAISILQGEPGQSGAAFGASLTGAADGAYGLLVTNTGNGGGLEGVSAVSDLGGAGVSGRATSTTGQVVGVQGTATDSPIGTGVGGTGTITGAYFAATGATTQGLNPTGVYGVAYVDHGVGVVGLAVDKGGYFEASGADGTGVYAKAPLSTFAVQSEGHVTQSHDAGGLVKALLFLDSDGNVLRCFNSQRSYPTAGSCGFSASKLAGGTYTIDLGFSAVDRFVSLTAYGNALASSASTSGNVVTAFFYDSSGGTGSDPAGFSVIVF